MVSECPSQTQHSSKDGAPSIRSSLSRRRCLSTSSFPLYALLPTTYFSIAHCIVEYAITNGTAQYKICARVRRKVLKMAAFAVPAKGFCRFALKP